MLTFVTWKWQGHAGQPYQAWHVNAMVEQLHDRVRLPHRTICITDDPDGIACETFPLWEDHAELRQVLTPKLPSCWRRLKLFDSRTTKQLGIADGEMVASLDLDLVFVRDATKFFDRPDDFCAWKRHAPDQPVSYCAAVLMFRAGTMDYLWLGFRPSQIRRIRNLGYRGSDQGWISYVLKGRYPGWQEQVDGIYSFSIWDKYAVSPDDLPANAIVVAFNGRKGKPWDREVIDAYPWIRQHWQRDHLVASDCRP